ncbi:hypothetical protein GCM10007301_55800 [Azorhizobium oxalatiphilum]|uniref:Autotransporter domain-containing protein n=1 Tax=Azorhizobium oxalatiphilum TaxID=980631 RepID=A0A917FM20_9HYPH|nr:autotransporter-associated beta strand repeat-containing protein [Azorhizobium oxalatiphilum]GGF88688.1 hypothetical protein GCM10007301_55800 [Azorhizobium oxalatiphilum]
MGAGTTTLTGTNAYTGATSIVGGTLLAGAGSTLSAASATSIGVGGTLNLGATAQAVNALTLAGGTLTNGTLTGAVTATGGALTNVGGTMTLGVSSGITVLTDAVYTGATTISGGTLTAAGVDDLSAASATTINAGGTLNLGGFAQTVNAIALNGGTLTNGVLTGAISSTGGAISGLSGTATLTATAGTTTLTGTNAYTGATTLSGGTLTAGAANALSATSATTINAGGTLNLGGFAQSVNAIALSGGTLTNGVLTGAVSSTGGAISGLSGTATLTATAGTTTLSGTNAYTGATSVTGAILTASTANALSAGSATTINAGGTLNLGGFAQSVNTIALSGGTLTNGALTGAITSTGGAISGLSGSATLTATAGTTTLSGTNAYTGATSVTGAILTASAANALSAGSATTINAGGTLNLGGFAQTVNALALSGGTLTNGALAGAISSTGGTVSGLSGTATLTASAGTTTLIGTNAYTGTTTLSGGTLVAGAANALSASSATSIAAGGTLDLGGFAQVVNAVALNGGTLQNGILTGAITSAGGAVVGLSGTASLTTTAGTTVLSGTNAYTGLTQVSGGTLTAAVANALSAGSATTINAGGTLDLAGLAQTVNAVTLNGGTLTNGALTGAVTTLGGAVSNLSGSASLAVNAGTTVLTGTNLYTGVTSIAGGTLSAGAANVLSAASSTSIGAGGTLDLGGFAQSVANVALNGGTLSNGSLTGAIASTGGVIANLSGSASLSVTAGTTLLSGTNTYAGLTDIAGGTVLAGAANALSASSATTVGVGGTLNLGGLAQTVNALTLAGGTLSNGSLTGAITSTGGAIAGLSGTASLSASAGTTTLSGVNSYTGLTSIAGGTVLAGAANSLSAGSATSIGIGGTLNLGGFAQTVNALTLAGGTLTNGSLAGAITSTGGAIAGLSGTAGLSVTAGTTLISGVNGYTGATGITGGTLAATAANALSAASTTTLNVGGTLDLGGFAQTVNSVVLNGGTLTNGALTGAITSTGGTISNLTGSATLGVSAGTTVMAGVNDLLGATTLTGGTLQVSGSLQHSNITVGSGATLDVTGAVANNLVTVNAGGTLSGGGTLAAVQVVGGVLSGVSGTTLTLGSLALDAASSINVDVGTTPASGALFNVTGNLTLDGTLNIVNAAPFGGGVYRLFDYGGVLVNAGLDIGLIPAGMNLADLSLQTAVSGQINLVNTDGLLLTFWNGSATAGPGTGTVNGGNGTWSVAGGNWTDANGTLNAPASYPVFAVFTGTPGVVTVDDGTGVITTSGMQFAVSGYQVVGDSITLAAPQTTIRVGDGTLAGAGYSATIASALVGTGGLHKTDLGTLILSGTNTYLGATVVDAGVLRAGLANTFSQTSLTTVNTGGTLDLGGTAQAINSVTLNGGTLTNGSLAGAVSSTGGFISGLSGTASLSVAAGTTTLTGTNAYTGATSVLGGTLAAGAANALSASSATTVSAGATLDLGGFTQAVNSLTLNGGTLTNGALSTAVTSNGGFISNLGGTGSVSVAGALTTTLTGTNSYSGATSIGTGSTLLAGAANALSAASTISVGTGAILNLGGASQTVGGVTLSGGLVTNGTLAGTVTSTGGALAGVAGTMGLTNTSGITTLTDATYTGATTINGGKVIAAGANDFSAASAVTVNTGGQLDLAGLSQTVNSVTLNGGALTNGALTGAVTSLGGAVALITGSASLTVNSGTTTLAVSNAYTGATTINGGTLIASAANALSAASATTINGGTLDLGGLSQTVNSVTLAGGTLANGSLTGAITSTGGAIATVGGTAGLTVTSGTTLVTGATYTGATTINGGTLTGAATNGLSAASATTINTGGTLDLGGLTQTVNALTLNGGTLTNGALAGAISSLGGTISGVSGTTTLGVNAGTTVLAGTNAFSGATTLTGGTLQVSGTLQNSNVTIGSGAALQVSGTLSGNLVTVNAGGSLSGSGTLAQVASVGGTLAGTSGTTLTMGSLTLDAASSVNVDVGTTPSTGALFNVTGNMTLDGTLNIVNAAPFGGGVYRLFDYGGVLTNAGLDIGIIPSGMNLADLSVQTGIAGQINLVNTEGLLLTFWNGSAVAGPGTGTINGGNGTWSLAGGNWTDANGTLNAVPTYPLFAVFQGTAGTVTVDDSGGPVTTTGMQFAVDGYQVVGDAITLVAPQTTVRVGDGTLAGAGYTTTIASALVGSGGLHKTDLGTLVLSGANSYLGDTVIDQGTVTAGASNTFSQTSATTVNVGATLNLGGFAQAIDSVTVNGGTLTNGALAGAVTSTGGAISDLSGTASVTVGTGTTTLSGSNAYTGATTVNGRLTASAANALSAASATTINTGGTLDLGGLAQTVNALALAGGTLTNGVLTGAITSTGGIISNLSGTATLAANAGTTTLSGTNAYTGATTINTGATVTASTANGLSAGSATTINTGGTLNLGGLAQTVNAVSLAGGTLTNGVLTGAITSTGGAISDLSGTATLVANTGTTTLSGTNAYSGSTTINTGATITASTANGLSAGSATTINAGGTLNLGGLAQEVNAVSLAGGTLTNGVLTGAITSTGGAISDLSGTATLVANAGTTTLSGTNAYTGATTINGGLLTAGTANALSAGSATTINAGGTLDLGGLAQTVNAVTLNGGTLTNGALTGAVTSAGGAVSGLSGSASLTANAGTTTLSGANAYTGATAINAGATISASTANGLSAGSATTINTGGTLDLGGLAQTVNTVSLAGGTLQNGTLTGAISSAGGSLASLGGTASLTVTAGTTTAVGTTYSGATTITGGTLIAGATNGLSAASATTIAAGGTLDLGSLSQTVNSISLAGGTLQNGTLTGAISSTGGTIFDIRGPASLQTLAGTTVMNGVNSFSGATSVSGGTLQINGTFRYSDIAVNAGGALVVGGTLTNNTVTINAGGTVSGSGALAEVVSVGGTLAGTQGTPLTMYSLVLDAASNVDVAVGSTPSSGAIFHVTGNLTLDGRLNITNATAFGGGVYRIFDYGGGLTDNGLDIGLIPPGMVAANLSVQTGISGQINLINSDGLALSFWNGPALGGIGGGTVNGGSGIWSVTNANWTDANGTFNAPATYPVFAVFQGTPGTVMVDDSAGAITSSGMQFAVSGYQVTGDSITLTDAQSILRVGDGSSASSGYTATIASALVGAGGLHKTDLGTLVLSGANSYAGATVVDQGTLAAGATNTFSATSLTTVNTGATLNLGGFAQAINSLTLNGGTLTNGALAGAITSTGGAISSLSGTASLAATSGSSTTLAGINSYTGATTINGTLIGLNDSAFSFASQTTVNTGGVMDLGGFVQSVDHVLLNGGTIQNGALAGDVSSTGGTLSSVIGVMSLSATGGTTTIAGSNGFNGPTTVTGGTLLVNGTLSNSAVTVNGGGVLSGAGSIGQQVTVQDGTLVGVHGSTLTVGALVLNAASNVNVDLGPTSSGTALFQVTNNLTLDGTLNITNTGSFGAGIYRLFNYGGVLTNNGLEFGVVPAGTDLAALSLQLNSGQVNLVNQTGVALQFWNGPATAGPGTGTVNGGSGVWSAANGNWTNASGSFNAAMTMPGFAVFSASPGIVTVDNSAGAVSVTGMQFATAGYLVNGGAITLADALTLVRVGDGTAAGGLMSATIASALVGSGGLEKTDLGRLILSGLNTYTGVTNVDAGALQAGADNALSRTSATTVFAGGTLDLGGFTQTVDSVTLSGGTLVNGRLNGAITSQGGTLNGIGGSTTLTALSGTTTLMGANIYTGATTINGGTVLAGGAGVFSPVSTVTINTGGTLDLGGFAEAVNVVTLNGGILQNGALSSFVTSTGGSVATMSGAMSLTQSSGTTTLTGTNQYTGATTVNGGLLQISGALSNSPVTVNAGAVRVDGTMSASAMTVNAGGTLSGTGTADVVTVQGGTLVGTAGSVLSMNALTLNAASSVNVDLGPTASGAALFQVNGALTLDGTLNVTNTGAFGVGVYRLFNYGGTLTDNGLAIGTVPGGTNPLSLTVQAALGQVNLINDTGVVMQFWNGSAIAGPSPGPVTGGAGTWNTVNGNWSNAAGTVNDSMSPNPGFVVFSATPGPVTVDTSTGAIGVTGMQFTTSGYLLIGDAIVLADAQTQVRVGDGTAAGATMIATIQSALVGSGGLDKSDLGTLYLAGPASYTGATQVDAGVLQAGVANAFSAASATTINASGTLDLGGFAQTINTVTLNGGILRNGALTGAVTTVGGTIANLSGTASVTASAGTSTLSGSNSYSGATTINGGTLVGGNVNAFSQASLTTVNSGGVLDLGATSQAIDQVVLRAGTVQNGNLSGAVSSFGGTVSGMGGNASLTVGSDPAFGLITTTLSGANAYTGATTVNGGTLQVSGTLTNSTVTVNSGGSLQGTGSITQSVAVASRGHLVGTAGSVLTMGALTLDAGSSVDVDLGTGPSGSGLFNVTGNLTLDGTLNLTNAGAFGAGIYQLFNYGTLVNNGLTFGTLPAGTDTAAIALQITSSQVNFVNATGVELQFWNGPATTGAGSGTVNGGSGTWNLTNGNWTDANGIYNAPMSPQPGFAVFQGTAGIVTVDGSGGQVGVTGMQFVTTGYEVTGDPLELTLPSTPIRVGDGTASGASTVATISAPLIGAGGLQKLDYGTLILSAPASYTGATVVDAGVLEAGAAGVFSATSLTSVQTGGTLDLGGFGQTIANVTLNGGTLRNGQLAGFVTSTGGAIANLGGTASLDVTSGVTTLAGTNSYTGATVVTNGTLAALNANAFSASSPTTVNSGGILDFANLDQAIANLSLDGGTIQNGAVSGTTTSTGGGVLNIRGVMRLAVNSGTTALSGTNTYSGPTDVNGGMVWAANSGALSPTSVTTLNAGGTLDLGGGVQVVDTINLVGGSLQNGALDGDVTSWGGTISNVTGPASLTLISGLTTLNGSTSFGGGTTIFGGTLAGSGSTGWLTVGAGGTIAPGLSTMSIGSSLTFQPGSTYAVTLAPGGQSSLISAGGVASLNGANLTVSEMPGTYLPGTRFTILTAAGGVTGTFAPTMLDLLFVDLELGYGATDVHLDVVRNNVAFASVAVTPNQRATAAAIDTLGTGNALFQAVAAQTTVAGAQQAFEQTSGASYASQTAVQQAQAGLLRGAILDRSRLPAGGCSSNRGSGGTQQECRYTQEGAGQIGLPYADVQPLAYGPFSANSGEVVAVPGTNNAFWAQGFGAWGEVNGGANTSSISSDTAGLFVGYDRSFAAQTGDWRLGFAAGYTSSTSRVSGLSSSMSSDDYHVALYGGGRIGAWGLRFGGAYSWSDIDAHRSVSFPGFYNNLSSDYSARTAQVFGELGYAFNWNGIGLEPFAGLSYVNVNTGAFQELGGAAALSSNGGNEGITYTTLGARVAIPMQLGTWDATFRGTLAWQHAFGDTSPQATMAFLGSTTPFTVAGTPIAVDAALVEAGLDMTLAPNTTLGLFYSGQLSEDAYQNMLKANFTVRF